MLKFGEIKWLAYVLDSDNSKDGTYVFLLLGQLHCLSSL